MVEPTARRGSLARLFVGPLNPHGFLNGTRENANGVDLNRNWLDVKGDKWVAPPPENGDYAVWRTLLNPEGPARYRRWWADAPFLLRLTGLLGGRTLHHLRASESPRDALALAQRSSAAAIMKGQYAHPDEPFFGGASPQHERLVVERFLQRELGQDGYDATALCSRDYHTGYGDWGHVQTVAPRATAFKQQSLGLLELFERSDLGIGFEAGEAFYPMEGSFVGRQHGMFPNIPVISFLRELGTVPGKGLLRQIESLHTIVQEFRGRRHGYVDARSREAAIAAYRRMFDPTDPRLWETILMEPSKAAPARGVFAASEEGQSGRPVVAETWGIHGVEGRAGLMVQNIEMMLLVPPEQRNWDLVFND